VAVRPIHGLPFLGALYNFWDDRIWMAHLHAQVLGHDACRDLDERGRVTLAIFCMAAAPCSVQAAAKSVQKASCNLFLDPLGRPLGLPLIPG